MTHNVSPSAAKVDMKVANNGSWRDAFMFGTEGDTTWSFTNQSFVMDVKRDRYDDTALLTLTTGNGRIVVDDVVQRILHFDVSDTIINANLSVGEYVYDLIMVDGSSGVRVPLMAGEVKIIQGVTAP
jgi:hypothetical protein